MYFFVNFVFFFCIILSYGIFVVEKKNFGNDIEFLMDLLIINFIECMGFDWFVVCWKYVWDSGNCYGVCVLCYMFCFFFRLIDFFFCFFFIKG